MAWIKNILVRLLLFVLGFGIKKLRGRITEESSGIYITLPKNWWAMDIGESTFLISADKEIGWLTFSVTHLAMTEKGRFINPFTQCEEVINNIEEGDFRTFILEGEGEREWAKIWDTETETYFIRFMYACTKIKKEEEMETVLQIINSVEEGPKA